MKTRRPTVRPLALAPLLVLLAACGGDTQSKKGSSGSIPTGTLPEAGSSGTSTPAGSGSGEQGTSGDRDRRDRGGGGTAKVTVVSAGSDAPEDAAEPGVITGVALFEGEPPVMQEIGGIKNTQGCDHHDVTPRLETLVANDGKLANVFVSISKGFDGEVTVPAEPHVLDQKGCLYLPHVSGMVLGQKLHALNSDPISHNVHVLASLNKEPNKTRGPSANPAEDPFVIEFDKAEEGVRLVCDLHPWMKAYVHVVEHPYFATTGPDGTFRIEGVPPGEYTLSAWHEHSKLKKQKAQVTVSPKGEVSVEYTFEL